MMKAHVASTVLRSSALVLLLAVTALACSSDDAEDGGGAGTSSGSGGAGGGDGTPDGGGAGHGGTTHDASTDAGGTGTGGDAFTLTSPAFEDGEMLPADSRCVSLGGDTGPSPALAWSGAPAGTLSFALTVTDKSTGISAGYAHWTMFDIPATTTELPAGVMRAAMPNEPAGAKQCANENAFVPGPGYFGPCGQTENPYEFRVYALDVASLPGVTTSSPVADVRATIEAHTLESTALTALSGP